MSQQKKLIMVNPRVFKGAKAFHESTLSKLGQLIDMDEASMCRLVKGWRYIERDRAERLCEALNVLVEDIFEEVRR